MYTQKFLFLYLLFVSHCSAMNDILKATISVKPKPFSDALDSLWSKIALGVNVKHFSLTTSEVVPKLGSDTQSMANLGLSCVILQQYMCYKNKNIILSKN
jgi:hypothetical protein